MSERDYPFNGTYCMSAGWMLPDAATLRREGVRYYESEDGKTKCVQIGSRLTLHLPTDDEEANDLRWELAAGILGLDARAMRLAVDFFEGAQAIYPAAREVSDGEA